MEHDDKPEWCLRQLKFLSDMWPQFLCELIMTSAAAEGITQCCPFNTQFWGTSSPLDSKTLVVLVANIHHRSSSVLGVISLLCRHGLVMTYALLSRMPLLMATLRYCQSYLPHLQFALPWQPPSLSSVYCSNLFTIFRVFEACHLKKKNITSLKILVNEFRKTMSLYGRKV